MGWEAGIDGCPTNSARDVASSQGSPISEAADVEECSEEVVMDRQMAVVHNAEYASIEANRIRRDTASRAPLADPSTSC